MVVLFFFFVGGVRLEVSGFFVVGLWNKEE